MEDTFLNKLDLELLDNQILKNRIKGIKIFSPLIVLNIFIIILLYDKFENDYIILIWCLTILMLLIVSLMITTSFLNRKIKKDKEDKKSKLIKGKVTKKEDKEHVEMVSSVPTEISYKRDCFVEIDNKEFFKVHFEEYKNILIGDEIILKFGKNSDIFFGLTKK